MAATKRFVCLANSRKNKERCVAGRELLKGKVGPWMRPVIAKTGFVDERSRLYAGGSEPQLGDVIQLSVRKREGRLDHQRENWIVNPQTRWQRVERFDWSRLKSLAEGTEPLFASAALVGDRRGRNDRIPEWDAHRLTTSLRLIYVPHMRLHPLRDGPRRFDGEFALGDVEYRLRITDPAFAEAQPRPTYDRDLGECLLTISLGEPWRRQDSSGPKHCYRLIAGVIERERYE